MRRLGWVGALLMLAGAAMADEARTADVVAAALPDATLKRIQASPDAYLDRTATMIGGYGGAGGIDAPGIERYIAVTRAEARAYRMRDLLAADLDNDGAVTEAEVGTLAPLLGARERGRLVRAFGQGDADGDGVLAAGELLAVADKAAQRRIGEGAASGLRALMAFDLDGNGLVSSAELGAVVAAAVKMSPAPARLASSDT